MEKTEGKTLYLECNSGISGDMTVAALLDLGVDATFLCDTLKTLPLEGYDIAITRVQKSGLSAMDFHVILDEEHENHDHDMEYLHGTARGMNTPEQKNTPEQENNPEQKPPVHSGEGDAHANPYTHKHRGLKEVLSILEASSMSAHAKEIAERIFTVLGEAEAKVHQETLETVHFHEVGAVDSIVDIAAVAICVDALNISNVIVTSMTEGSGTIRCAHGILPVPVPAVTAIMEKYTLPIRISEVLGELITPTGAAIVAALKTSSKLPHTMIIEKCGLGAGKRQYECPGLLRAMLLRAQNEKTSEEEAASDEALAEAENRIVRLESNIDDCTGEALGYVSELLMEAGARDVHYVPVYMKKNRPAYELVVLCTEEKRAALENIIFQNTTTIGIRRSYLERTVLPRALVEASTIYGTVQCKEVTLPDGTIRRYPEYEELAAICRREGLSYQTVLDEVRRALKSYGSGALRD